MRQNHSIVKCRRKQLFLKYFIDGEETIQSCKTSRHVIGAPASVGSKVLNHTDQLERIVLGARISIPCRAGAPFPLVSEMRRNSRVHVARCGGVAQIAHSRVAGTRAPVRPRTAWSTPSGSAKAPAERRPRSA